MIPKAIILVLAKEEALRETTVEKDYVLGWMLYGVARHPYLSRWAFKGGTCLKKCFFETYRFSEDLDFTVQPDERLTTELIHTALRELCDSVSAESGSCKRRTARLDRQIHALFGRRQQPATE